MAARRQFQILGVLGLVVLGLAVGLPVLFPSNGPQKVAAAPPTGSALTQQDVVARVLSYVETERPDDPLIQVDDGVWIKRSNYHGVTIGGTVYYYALLPHASFDPLSRGAVPSNRVQVIQVLDDPGFRILIYTITGPLAKRET